MVVALTVCFTLIHHFDYPVDAIISKMHTPTQSRGPKSSSITCPLVGQPTDLHSDVWTQQMSHVHSTSMGRGRFTAHWWSCMLLGPYVLPQCPRI